MAKTKNGRELLILPLKLYSQEAIFGAAYVFIDRAYIFFDMPDDEHISAEMRAKTADLDIESIKGEFMNELLNYTHRLNIGKTNQKIREYIVERALFSSVHAESGEDDSEAFDDPLGIAVPWEEKYGDDESKIKTNDKKS